MAEDWISITAAAARLTAAGDPIDRSTLSRYVKQHAEALPSRREGRSNLIDFERLAAHRGENIRVQSPAPEVASVPQKDSSRFRGSQSEGTARKAQADARMRELDLGEREGELTPTDEVDRGGRNSMLLMRSALDRAVETEAAMLSVKYGWDERTVRLALKGFVRIGVGIFNQEILALLDGFQRRRDGGVAVPAEDGDGLSRLQ